MNAFVFDVHNPHLEADPDSYAKDDTSNNNQHQHSLILLQLCCFFIKNACNTLAYGIIIQQKVFEEKL